MPRQPSLFCALPRLKQQAEDEARATKQQAKVDAEEIARRWQPLHWPGSVSAGCGRVMEEMDSKQQQHEMAAVRRAAEAEAQALKAAATQEAVRLRKNAEEEVCILCVAALYHLSRCSSRLNTPSAPAPQCSGSLRNHHRLAEPLQTATPVDPYFSQNARPKVFTIALSS